MTESLTAALVFSAGQLRSLVARLEDLSPDAEVVVGYLPGGPRGPGLYAHFGDAQVRPPIPLFEVVGDRSASTSG